MKKLLLLAIVAFLLALLLKTPASMVAAQIPPEAPVSLQGVSGSLWEGKATQVIYEGVNLGEMTWTINPLTLLTGGAKGDFSLQGDEITANGNYKISLSKTVTLDNAQFATTGHFINRFQRYGKVKGDLRGSIDHLEMQLTEPLAPPVVVALINWEQGGLDSPIKLAEGNYQLKIEPESKGILIGRITANEAPVDIKGHLTLDSQWQYQTDIKLKTMPKGQSLQGMLSMIGQPQPDGYIHIKEKGKLKP